jgi:hypothetical protein
MSMRLISFDVGIKNLAYCVFSVDSSSDKEEPSQKWSIPEWNCVNLIADQDSSNAAVKFCCYKMKGKKKTDPDKICNKPAKWLAPHSHVKQCAVVSLQHCLQNHSIPTLSSVGNEGFSGETIEDIHGDNNTQLLKTSYCDLHAKKHGEYIIPKKRHSTSHLTKLKLTELEKEYDSVCTVSVSGEPRLKMKKSELIERVAKYYESKCFVSVFGANEKKKTKTAGETDLVTIGRAIRRQLDSDSSVDGATHVIIENQISTLASRMKTIQGMIAQYFIMRFGDSVQIEFVSSHNKLKGFLLASSSSQPTQKEPDGKKTKYKANKSDGIIICRQFIDANPEMESWSPVFEKSKKRDDFADCFLQGIWYLKSSEKIYYADNLKINIVVVS